jgi:hypothetical protein
MKTLFYIAIALLIGYVVFYATKKDSLTKPPTATPIQPGGPGTPTNPAPGIPGTTDPGNIFAQ